MKYAEYQVWFHAFNNAVLGLSRRTDLATTSIAGTANTIANICVDKFKEVEMPEAPDMSSLGAGIDLKGIVEQVAKDAMKGNASGKRKP
jgi:hypothetical protein